MPASECESLLADFARFFWSQSQILAAAFSSSSSLNTESAICSGMRADITVTVPVESTVGGVVGGYEVMVHPILLGNWYAPRLVYSRNLFTTSYVLPAATNLMV